MVTKEEFTCRVNKLLPIQMLQEIALKDAVSSFASEYNFSQCVGAIDGTHISITPPQESSTDYFNRQAEREPWQQSVLMTSYYHHDEGTVNNRGDQVSVCEFQVFKNSSEPTISSAGQTWFGKCVL